MRAQVALRASPTLPARRDQLRHAFAAADHRIGQVVELGLEVRVGERAARASRWRASRRRARGARPSSPRSRRRLPRRWSRPPWPPPCGAAPPCPRACTMASSYSCSPARPKMRPAAEAVVDAELGLAGRPCGSFLPVSSSTSECTLSSTRSTSAAFTPLRAQLGGRVDGGVDHDAAGERLVGVERDLEALAELAGDLVPVVSWWRSSARCRAAPRWPSGSR